VGAQLEVPQEGLSSVRVISSRRCGIGEMRETYTTSAGSTRHSWEVSTNEMDVKVVDLESFDCIHLAQEEISGGVYLTRR
jgi:hypothetical protein